MERNEKVKKEVFLKYNALMEEKKHIFIAEDMFDMLSHIPCGTYPLVDLILWCGGSLPHKLSFYVGGKSFEEYNPTTVRVSKNGRGQSLIVKPPEPKFLRFMEETEEKVEHSLPSSYRKIEYPEESEDGRRLVYPDSGEKLPSKIYIQKKVYEVWETTNRSNMEQIEDYFLSYRTEWELKVF